MVSRTVACAWFGVALACATAHVAAATRTEPEQIRGVAERFIVGLATPGSVVHAVAGHLDDRLNLAPCVGELTPGLPPGVTVRARTSVGVRCPDAGGWTLYVPVTVESEAPVLVTRRTLSRGELPMPADLEAVTRRVPGLATQFPSRLADIEGRRLRRAVGAGDALPLDALEPARLVERGQQVTVVAEVAGVAVRAGAVSLEAGGHGDRIRVRNPGSGRIVEGVVQPDGTIAAGP